MTNTSSNIQQSHVPVFDGENYDFWYIKNEDIFCFTRSMGLVESGFAEPESTATLTQDQAKALKEKIQRDARALSQIQDGTYGEDISDARIVEKILINLPKKFGPIVAVVEETKDISKLSIQELMGSLKFYEQRWSRRSEKLLESAFQSKLNFSSKNTKKKSSTQEQSKGESSRGGGQGRGRGRDSRGRFFDKRRTNDEEPSQRCNICKRSSRVDKDGWFQGKPQCHNCKRFGYVQKDCQIKTNQQVSFTEEKEGEGNLFFACQAVTETKNDVWFLDSGCSNHMTSNKSIFLDMDASINSQVKMGNEHLFKLKAKPHLELKQRRVPKVPDLEQNLQT
ncbi:hypothetical protein F0562_023096 [Nyssa sinensis]|uniref:Retrovirus-related Pol polyprotein from transposon TNT 1-94-like beta-barrel domain-containing protein n=1 Tax=Nyssa sinensis TaxID=561372 RepID=A0A5J5BGZ8_9ASTE|nr:hypothetical protein F0562_023096 [Nyssa sinensis]